MSECSIEIVSCTALVQAKADDKGQSATGGSSDPAVIGPGRRAVIRHQLPALVGHDASMRAISTSKAVGACNCQEVETIMF